MPTRQTLCAGVLALNGMLAFAVEAQDATCTRELGRIEVKSNLDVVASCRLNGTVVRGNVKLFAGGSLTAREARIFGNVEGRRADFVDFDRSVVSGNVRLEELVGDRSLMQRSEFGGNATLRNNRSRLEIMNSDFAGKVELARNKGSVVFSGNSVEGDLRCTGNDPVPVGLGNRVDGNTRGQCQNLRREQEPAAAPPPPTSQPPPTSPPPATAAPPSSSSPPSATPTGSASPPAAATPPAASAPPPPAGGPPAATPAPTAAAPPADPPAADVLDDGGAGALGASVALLLPLLAWRRRDRQR